MVTTYRIETFEDIYTAVMRRMKLPLTDEDALSACKEAINSRLDSIAYRKKWRWRKARYDLKIEKKYTTGTIAVTNNDREITGTGTAWTEDHVGWWIEIGNRDEVHRIVAVDEGAQTAFLSSVYTGVTDASTTYTMYKCQYGLPPDLEEVDVVWHDHRRHPVDIISPQEMIQAIVRNPGAEGWATALTAYGFKEYSTQDLDNFLLNHDFLGTNDDSLMATVFPHIPDEDYTLHMLYTQKLEPLVNPGDKPKLPREKRHALVIGAYADMLYRERLDETAAVWERKFEVVVGEIEADHEYTDDRPRLMVGGRWWRRKKKLDPQSADLGGWFDRYYTPYDN